MKTTYNYIAVSFTIALAVSALMFLAFISGEKSKQTEIERRALKTNQEHYSREELELIIFGESQL